MASSDRQPEGPSVEEIEGKQAELVDKLTEISTSMRQCADIFDSFTRFVRQFSFRPTAPEAPVHHQPSRHAPSRGSGSAERSDPPSHIVHIEGVGSPSYAQGTEVHRRPAHSHPPGPMLPPAAPTFHAAGLSGLHPSLASMHSISGPSSYPSHRPSSSASGTGSGGAHETRAPSRRAVDTTSSTSERRASSIKHGKRKRPRPAEAGEYDYESDIDTGAEGSPQTEVHEVPSENDQPPRRPLKRPAESMDESLSARVFLPRGKLGTETPHIEDRPVEPGPSIVVFSSGAGSSKTRTIHSRGPTQVTTRSRKEKKPKDPNAPKQPPPAYIVYQNEVRESMRTRFPAHSPTELVKEIAATWKTLPNSERQRYKDYASVEKDRWVAELAAYQANLTNPDEGQKTSESTFLATTTTTGVSDSPPGSSPHQSPALSDTESDLHKVRRVVSQQGVPGTSGSYEHRESAQTSSSFPGPSVVGMPPGGENRAGRRTGQEYEGQSQEPPIRLERSLSRHGYTPSPSPGLYGTMSIPPPPGGRAYPGRVEPRTSSTRLPSIGSLGFSHTLQPVPRELSPGPTRELSESEGEPAPKRRRTKTEEDEGDGSSRLTHEGRESE